MMRLISGLKIISVFFQYRYEYTYVWQKQKEWEERYSEQREPSEFDIDDFVKLGLRLGTLDYTNPGEEVLCVEWRHDMGMFGYHKSYWFSENDPYPEEIEVRLLATANCFHPYHTFFHLDSDGLVKIANGDLNEYRSLISTVLDDLNESTHTTRYTKRVVSFRKFRSFVWDAFL